MAQDVFFTWHHLRRVFAKLVLAEISNIEFAKTEMTFFIFLKPAIFCQNEFAISTRFSIWVGNPKNILRKNNYDKEYSTLKDELLYAHTLSEFFKYCIV